jgi:hypothetical protein
MQAGINRDPNQIQIQTQVILTGNLPNFKSRYLLYLRLRCEVKDILAKSVLRICWIRRIRLFLGLPDPHPKPLVTSTDPAADPAPDPALPS